MVMVCKGVRREGWGGGMLEVVSLTGVASERLVGQLAVDQWPVVIDQLLAAITR